MRNAWPAAALDGRPPAWPCPARRRRCSPTTSRSWRCRADRRSSVWRNRRPSWCGSCDAGQPCWSGLGRGLRRAHPTPAPRSRQSAATPSQRMDCNRRAPACQPRLQGLAHAWHESAATAAAARCAGSENEPLTAGRLASMVGAARCTTSLAAAPCNVPDPAAVCCNCAPLLMLYFCSSLCLYPILS